MREERAKEVLAALSPEVLAERQRIVDAAVRAARGSGHCDTFNEMIGLVMPEMVTRVEGYNVALDSDGGSCRTREGQSIWAYYYGDEALPGFDANGYNASGFDRDGFNRVGHDAEGFDANDIGRARSRVTRRTRWLDDAGNEQVTNERWWSTGYGEYSMRDADGNARVGRPATPEEAAAEEAAAEAIRAKYGDRFNPTTWKPPASENVTSTSE